MISSAKSNENTKKENFLRAAIFNVNDFIKLKCSLSLVFILL